MYFQHDFNRGKFLTECSSFVGWLYTIWAGLMLLSGLLTTLVWWKGGQWREIAEAREAEYAER